MFPQKKGDSPKGAKIGVHHTIIAVPSFQFSVASCYTERHVKEFVQIAWKIPKRMFWDSVSSKVKSTIKQNENQRNWQYNVQLLGDI